MWDSFRDLRYRLPDGIFTEELLKNSLKQLFLAIDYIHTECKFVHTGGTNFIISMVSAPKSKVTAADRPVLLGILLIAVYRHQSRQYFFSNRRRIYSWCLHQCRNAKPFSAKINQWSNGIYLTTTRNSEILWWLRFEWFRFSGAGRREEKSQCGTSDL